jgi:hypothetical protein
MTSFHTKNITPAMLSRGGELMPSRPSAQPPTPPDIRSFRNRAEVDAAIAILRQRIADIEQLRADRAHYDDLNVYLTQNAIRDAIREIFGKDSAQFERYGQFSVDDGPQYMLGAFQDPSDFVTRHQQQFERQAPGAIARIEGLIRGLEEKREELRS